MSKNLTSKQETFVQGLVQGLSQRKAYIEAGYSTKDKEDNYIDSNASKLFKNTKVLTRYRELLKESSNMILWSREQAFSEYEWLKNKAKSEINEEGIRKATSDAFIQSMEGMNQMAFTDLELADKKLKAEIDRMNAEAEKAQKEVENQEADDDKVLFVDSKDEMRKWVEEHGSESK